MRGLGQRPSGTFPKCICFGGGIRPLIEAIRKICPDLLWMNEAQIRGGLSNPGPGTTRASQTRMTSVTRFFSRRVTQVTRLAPGAANNFLSPEHPAALL